MIGRIVLAVGPATSAEVVAAAFGLAVECRAPLLAVRTWHDPNLPLAGGSRRNTHRAVGRRAPEGAARARRCAGARARATHPDAEVATLVVDDDLEPFLTALSTRANLLVLGRSTRLGHRSSPVDALVRQAACPILVVPPTRPSSRSGTRPSTSTG